jgi:hypothetical protein
MVFAFRVGLMIQWRSATRRWNWLTRSTVLFVGRVDTQGGPRLGFLLCDPCRIATGVKLCVVCSAEERHEWIRRVPVAAAMSAPVKRQRMEIVGDMPEHRAALGLQQFEDFGLVTAQIVYDGIHDRVVGSLVDQIAALDLQLETAAARDLDRLGSRNCTDYTDCTACLRTLPLLLSTRGSFVEV